MKLVHRFTALLLLMFSSLAMANLNTKLYLTNNSDETICIKDAYEINDNHSTPLITFKLLNPCIAPLETKPAIELSRSNGVERNGVYQFQFGVGKKDGGTDFVMQQRIMGTLLFSHMWLSASKGYTATPAWYYDRDIHSLPLNKHSDVVYRSTRAKIGSSDNIYYVVQPQWKSPQRPTNVKKFRLLTYNTWGYTGLFDKGVIIPAKMDSRLQAISRHVSGYDAIVFEELFFKKYRNELLGLLEKEYPYHTKVAGVPGLFTAGPFSGGVVIMSHWPITKQARYTYKKTRGVDGFVAKGVSYARIEKCVKGGTRCKAYNLFGTQVRANSDAADQKVRHEQLQEMADFIKQQQIPHDEPVLIAGDLNTYKYTDPSDYHKMLNILQAVELPVSGHKYSYDTKLNTWAKGEGVQDQFDYMLYGQGYQHPVTSSKARVLTPRSVDSALWTKWDLSDHFPMEGLYVFSK